MADVRPIQSVHFDPGAVGAIADVLAPPYDVIDAEQRRELLDRSSRNVVAIDLPEDPAGGDRYAHAATVMDEWLADGALTRDSEPALWALAQEFTGPDGSARTRHAILARVRVEDYGAGRIRPHERTQPGPKQDRLDLTRATRHNLSPIFSLTSADAWPHVAPATTSEPWAEVTEPDGTVNRIWRIADATVHEAVASTLAAAELLIADGHHRYETARTYAEEIGDEDGPHRYTLMALTGLGDPGLAVFPTHRLLTGLDGAGLEQLEQRLREAFEVTEVARDELDPAGEPGTGVLGFAGARADRALRLRLRDRTRLDGKLADRSAAYRELDAVVLETLVLSEILGMTEDDIAAKRGIGYAKSLADVEAALAEGSCQAAFILRPTPVEAVREVAEAGETMPPKSTFFHPKIPTGIVFNPVG